MKYAALLLNGLALALFALGMYGLFQLTQTRSSLMRPSVVELAPLPVELRNEHERVVASFGAMSRIQSQAFRVATAPQSLIAMPIPGSEVAGSVQMPSRSMSLHLDNMTAGTQSVVIDGQLVRQGTRLPDGGRVVRVQPNEAVVAERLGRQTLTLTEAEIRVGTLRWPDGSLASTNTQKYRAGLPGSQSGPNKSLP
jgi:hypothetical protein